MRALIAPPNEFAFLEVGGGPAGSDATHSEELQRLNADLMT
jgi:hypothetical protein